MMYFVDNNGNRKPYYPWTDEALKPEPIFEEKPEKKPDTLKDYAQAAAMLIGGLGLTIGTMTFAFGRH